MNYYVYKSTSDPAHYIFKSEKTSFSYFLYVTLLYTFNNSKEKGQILSPPIRDCRELEPWEIVKHKMLGHI